MLLLIDEPTDWKMLCTSKTKVFYVDIRVGSNAAGERRRRRKS